MKPLAALLFAALAPLALAQAPPGPYAVVASQADLDDGGTLTGAVPSCLLQDPGPPGALQFFDVTSGAFAAFAPGADAGNRTSIRIAGDVLDAALGTDVVACRDVVAEVVNGISSGRFFAVLAGADGLDRAVRIDPATAEVVVLTDPASAVDAGDGITGIAHAHPAQQDGTVYLARAAFFGAPEDGLYAVGSAEPGQVPAALLTDPRLDLTDLTNGISGQLLATSSEFGEGPYRNVLVEFTLAEPVGIGVVWAPCDGPDPLFTRCDDGGIEALAGGNYPDGDALLARYHVLNNAFGADDGETVGAIVLAPGDPFEPELVFTEAGLAAETGVAGFTPSAPAGVLIEGRDPDDPSDYVVYLAGSDAFGGTPGIYSVVPPLPVAADEGPGAASLALGVAPNPVSDAARVALTLAEATPALTVTVVDALGRRVVVLHEGSLAPGTHAFALGADALAPGVYVVVVEANGVRHTERVFVVR